MDILGTLLVLSMSISVFLALQWAGVSRPWNDPGAIGLLIVAAVLFCAFIFVEWHLGNRAIVQGRFLKRRNIAVNCVFKFLLVTYGCFLRWCKANFPRSSSGSMFILIYHLPIYFQSVHGVSAAQSGIDNIPLILGSC